MTLNNIDNAIKANFYNVQDNKIPDSSIKPVIQNTKESQEILHIPEKANIINLSVKDKIKQYSSDDVIQNNNEINNDNNDNKINEITPNNSKEIITENQSQNNGTNNQNINMNLNTNNTKKKILSSKKLKELNILDKPEANKTDKKAKFNDRIERLKKLTELKDEGEKNLNDENQKKGN